LEGCAKDVFAEVSLPDGAAEQSQSFLPDIYTCITFAAFDGVLPDIYGRTTLPGCISRSLEADEKEILRMVFHIGTTNQEDDDPGWAEAHFDTRTGDVLDPVAVEAARSEELAYMRSIGLYEKCTISECIRMAGKPPISTKWVDVNKGSKESPDIRCRLVARDFRVKGEGHRDDLFAAMPPLEAKRLLFLMAASTWGAPDPIKVMLIDVKKAHLNGHVDEGTWACIELPREDFEDGMCGRLKRWLYGMRPAAKAWEDDYAARLCGAGFVRGVAAPTVFYHPEWDVRIVVHGDDFTTTGRQQYLDKFRNLMAGWYLMTVKGVLGPEAGDKKELCILNRRLRVERDALVYEPDPKHLQLLCDEFGLQQSSKGLDSPFSKEDGKALQGDDEELESGEATKFRAMAARASYIAQDRVDVMFASKEVCRDMSRPTVGSMRKLKRLARYLLEYPGGEWRFKIRSRFEATVLRAYSDSDWAGCKDSRKSTSGGMLVISGNCVRAWSSTQATIATSSGEAELIALVKAAAEGLGFVSVARDLGVPFALHVFVDSTAAQSIASRAGLGRLKHVEVKHLWVQEAVRKGAFRVARISGVRNPADILTKAHTARRLIEVAAAVGVRICCRDPSRVHEPSGDFGPEGVPEDGADVEFVASHIQVSCEDVHRAVRVPTVQRRWADMVEDSDSEYSSLGRPALRARSEGGCCPMHTRTAPAVETHCDS
jgi:hypothetical protein